MKRVSKFLQGLTLSVVASTVSLSVARGARASSPIVVSPVQTQAAGTTRPKQSSAAMTNADVLTLVRLGISDDIIIDKIYATKSHAFDTTVTGLKALKVGNVSDPVIRAMINPQRVQGATVADNVAPAPKQVVPPVAESSARTLPTPASPVNPPSTVNAPYHSTDGKIRLLYIDPAAVVTDDALANRSSLGPQPRDYPRSAEIEKIIAKVCPAFVLYTSDPHRYDFAIGIVNPRPRALISLPGPPITDGVELRNEKGMAYGTLQRNVEKAMKDLCGQLPRPN
jgi:hypothetical protein